MKTALMTMMTENVPCMIFISLGSKPWSVNQASKWAGKPLTANDLLDALPLAADVAALRKNLSNEITHAISSVKIDRALRSALREVSLWKMVKQRFCNES